MATKKSQTPKKRASPRKTATRAKATSVTKRPSAAKPKSLGGAGLNAIKAVMDSPITRMVASTVITAAAGAAAAVITDEVQGGTSKGKANRGKRVTETIKEAASAAAGAGVSAAADVAKAAVTPAVNALTKPQKHSAISKGTKKSAPAARRK